MADGTSKPIKDIKIGDKVLAADPQTGETGPRAVTALIEGNGEKQLVDLTIETGQAQKKKNGNITATEGHPFWVPALHQWVEAGDLKAGQWLQTSAGTWVQITATQHRAQSTKVYNLTVNDLHTYYVLAGATPLLVHNCNTVYRGDSRSPGEIRAAGGFMPQSPGSGTSLLDYASDINNHSRYVGTSKSGDIAATYFGGRHGYVYEIRGAPNGIDVNRELGPLSPSPHESEIAFDGGILWDYVTRVWKKDEWGEIDFDYDAPIWVR
ncbi:polymorphic toxin-type HINT domain-containing protein (plasmid) [Streptomyces sp. NBC_01768]|nr:polymorphic toxin-type HINT domain-containing protein [Streptomyces sp. NBC_01768]